MQQNDIKSNDNILDDEKRRHKRRKLQMDIFCKRLDGINDCAFAGKTIDISPSGLLLESNCQDIIDKGDLYSVEMDVADLNQTAQLDGKVSAYARITRITAIEPENKSAKKYIALEFCNRPQYQQ